MTSEESSAAQSPSRRTDSANDTGRRTLIRGAAWTLPVVATTVATPLAAASFSCSDLTQTVTATDAAMGARTVLLPPGLLEIRYTVVAGNSGAFWPADGTPVGLGATVSGTIPASALGGATSLEVIAGQSAQNKMGSVGGRGYGNGGDSSRGVSWSPNTGGTGGGGGSAILLGSTPLVVAGGGGGGRFQLGDNTQVPSIT